MIDGAALLAGIGSTALITGAAVGAGASVLAALGLLVPMCRTAAAAWSFAIGLGVLGWVLFFFAAAGRIAPPILAGLALVASCGLILLRKCASAPRAPAAHHVVWWVLAVGLLVALVVDLMEGLSPPADADSLAYHFALPKQFITTDHLEFVPRAVDGAIPLLIHMTYLASLGLGGEIGLTLWTMVSGWMAGLLVYVVACRYMAGHWALVTTLLFFSVPAMVYSGGAGHVEPRLALFATAGAVAMADAVAQRNFRLVAIAGLAAGFFAASKYTGLLFAAACALSLFLRWRSLTAFALYAAAVCLAGFQWYAWNWFHTGDPVFPALWQTLDLPDSTVWTASQNDLFRATYSAAENPYPRSLIWMVAYPFAITLWPAEGLDAGRTGLGPYALLILPFAVVALWRWRKRLLDHPLFAVGLVCAAFYVLWFYSDAPQRIRHLLPIYPLLLICLTIAAVRLYNASNSRGPIVAVAGASLCLNLAVQTAFGIGYAHHLFTGESRNAFLRRNVPSFDVIAPIEAAMTPDDRVLTSQRQLIYLFERPVFYYHMIIEAQVTPRIAQDKPGRFLQQLRARGITLLLLDTPDDAEGGDVLTRATKVLERFGCAREIRRLEANAFSSRTLFALSLGRKWRETRTLYRLTNGECRL